MAHMDVVPALEIENWIEDPFSGLVENDFIWGRGALDNKSSLIAILESIEYLLSTDFKPNRDLNSMSRLFFFHVLFYFFLLYI